MAYLGILSTLLVLCMATRAAWCEEYLVGTLDEIPQQRGDDPEASVKKSWVLDSPIYRFPESGQVTAGHIRVNLPEDQLNFTTTPELSVTFDIYRRYDNGTLMKVSASRAVLGNDALYTPGVHTKNFSTPMPVEKDDILGFHAEYTLFPVSYKPTGVCASNGVTLLYNNTFIVEGTLLDPSDAISSCTTLAVGVTFATTTPRPTTTTLRYYIPRTTESSSSNTGRTVGRYVGVVMTVIIFVVVGVLVRRYCWRNPRYRWQHRWNQRWGNHRNRGTDVMITNVHVNYPQASGVVGLPPPPPTQGTHAQYNRRPAQSFPQSTMYPQQQGAPSHAYPGAAAYPPYPSAAANYANAGNPYNPAGAPPRAGFPPPSHASNPYPPGGASPHTSQHSYHPAGAPSQPGVVPLAPVDAPPPYQSQQYPPGSSPWDRVANPPPSGPQQPPGPQHPRGPQHPPVWKPDDRPPGGSDDDKDSAMKKSPVSNADEAFRIPAKPSASAASASVMDQSGNAGRQGNAFAPSSSNQPARPYVMPSAPPTDQLYSENI